MNNVRRLEKITLVMKEIGETLRQKLVEEEPTFTGKIDFTIHCKDGGIGSIEAFSKYDIKNGKSEKKL